MSDLLKRVRDKAARVKGAFETHQDAYLQHIVNGQAWEANPGKDTNHALVNSESNWDNARDLVATLAGGLYRATEELLHHSPANDLRALRRANHQLHQALDAESTTFDAFNKAREDATQKREAYEMARTEVIHRAWPVVEILLGMGVQSWPTGTGFHAALYFDQAEGLAAKGKPQTPPPPDTLAVKPDPERAIETDLDGVPAHNTETPAWASAPTKAEQDRIIYENRKKTLGQKAAGRMIAQERGRAKRGQWVYTDDSADIS